MKVQELTGTLLDYWVARVEETVLSRFPWRAEKMILPDGATFAPSSSWAQGGPIIERERIGFMPVLHDGETCWMAAHPGFGSGFHGPTPLLAAMRAYVASKFGDEVPNEVAT